ncbi:hypothetical protein BDW22DRAFT_390713 [Trametopsis cervina]|nr:hypothetical protein BDW22DRAFT_390713 [Trametopsis cervina]
MTAPREPVAIFWDLENCQLPSTAGLSAVDNIRSIAQSYGFVKLFKAYLDVAEQNSPKTSILRSELQSCGVTVTDCPHSNRKDVADKMMIVFAMDDLPPATVIILSGDRDFVYAASTLRLRAYHVVVIGPKTCHHQYQGRASEVLDWDVAVLSKQGTLTRGRHYSISTASPTTDVSALERSSKSTNVPLPTPKPSRRSSFRDDRSPPSPRVPSTYAKSQGPAGVVTTSSAHQDHLVPEIDIEVATPPNECVLQDSDRHLLLAVEGGQADDEVESSTLSPLDIPPNTMLG